MTKLELKKIVTIIFHVLAFVISVIALGLILFSLNNIDSNDEIFKYDNNIFINVLFIVLSYIMGTISLILFNLEWINTGKIRPYLVAFFFGQILILLGNTLILLL